MIPGVPVMGFVGVSGVSVVSLVMLVTLVSLTVSPVDSPASLTRSVISPFSPRLQPSLLSANHSFPFLVLLHNLLLLLHHLSAISVGVIALVDVETKFLAESLGKILPWLLLVCWEW